MNIKQTTMQRTITRYIPAGMNIKPPADIFDDTLAIDGRSKKKSRKKQSVNDNQDLHLLFPSFSKPAVTNASEQICDDKSGVNKTSAVECTTQNKNKTYNPVAAQTAMKHNLTPPKVICKNKNILEDTDIDSIGICSFKINDDTLSSLTQHDTMGQEKFVNKQNVDNCNSKNSRNIDAQDVRTDFKPKVAHMINKHKITEQCKSKNSLKEKNIKNSLSKCNTLINQNTKCTISDEENKSDVVKSVPLGFITKDALLKQINIPCSNNSVLVNSTDSNVIKRGLPLLKPACYKKSVEISKILKNMVVHGIVIPKPITSIKETFFNFYILTALKIMKIEFAKPVQSYMWPAVQRGLNIFMIGPPQSGKTLAYLPALCSFAIEMEEKYSVLPKHKGPVIIILCSNDNQCNEIGNLINTLLEHSWESVRIGILTKPSSLQECDVVVAVLSELEKYLEYFSLDRLCHLVIEDASVLLKSYARSIEKFLKTLDEMQRNRSFNKNIQVIVSSKKWTADVGVLMKQLYTPPVVFFESFFEAAKYSNITFNKKKFNVGHKSFHLEDILNSSFEQKYNTHKTIVFCDNNEISEVAEYLEMKGIECISISNDLIEDEVFENEDMWRSLTRGRYKVLLCTDERFEQTKKISDANWLIHYSLPQDWTKFQNRFRSLANNIKSPLDNEGDSNCSVKNCSYIFTVADKNDNSFNETFNEIITSKIEFLKL